METFNYKYDDLFNPTLEAIHALGGSASVSEIEDGVSRILKLSDNAINEIHRGKTTKLSYRLAWARNYLKTYGLLDNSSRGIWTLTSKGVKVKSVDQQDVKKKVKKMQIAEGEAAEPREKERLLRAPRHNEIRDLLYEIGKMEGKVSEREYKIDGEKMDVAWKRIATGNPQYVFEVQIGGNFYEALAKLKHAWDIWNSRPYLVTTQQYRSKALQWLKGSFHEIESEVTIIECDRVRELHDAVRKAKEIKNEFGIK